jgi:uncharacterized membrane protein YebE (DUF533 family)
MDLVGTLGKMILNNAMKGKGGNVLGGLLGGAAQQGGAGAGGLGELLGSLTKAGGAQGGGAGGLGDLLGKATQGGGGLGDLLGQLQGGQANQSAPQQQGGGDLGGLLGGLLGGGNQGGGQAGGLGDLLGAALGKQLPSGGAAVPQPTNQQSDQAGLLIKAMISAAKADGSVDAQEQEKIVGQLGDIDQEEAAFIRAEMQKPLDVAGLVNSVPRGMEHQVYLLSLMAIDLDSKAEADYLDQLAQGLNISNETSNQLHTELGSPLLYA